MKKKALIYALLASVLVGTVASCDDKNNNNNNIVNVDPTPKENPKKEEPDNPKKEEPETPKYNFEDNEESKKVYEEFSKYFTNVTYEDFLLNAKKSSVVGGILFEYKELSVTLNFDGSLKLKSLISVDGNKKTSTEYKYLNNEWVKTKETLTLNGKELITYSIGFNADDSYYGKDEYTYDDNGNQLTKVHSIYENDAWIYYSKSEKTYDESGSALTLITSRYLNNEWIKTSEDKYINGEEKNIYSVYVDVDGKITRKNEYTYDENGSKLGNKAYIYLNNQWIKIFEDKYIEGEIKRVYSLDLNEDNTFNFKTEYTYDSKGNVLSSISSSYKNNNWILSSKEEYEYDENGNKVKEVVSSLINNEWIIISESKRINGELKPILYYLFNDDGSFSSKTEQTYDEFGNTLTGFTLKYLNNSWINSHKFEYTYDASGKKLTETSIFYENNELDSKYEYVYDSNGNKVEHIRSKYINNNWALSSKYEYTYDENGSQLGNKEYIYLNNQWIKIFEYKYIEGKIKRVYSLNLNEDNTFNFKTEYTYDSKGNELSSISSSYKNNNWILSFKEEYEYDEAGNELGNKRYSYISNQWVKVYEDKYFDGEIKNVCTYGLDDNFAIGYIYENIFDEDGNQIAHSTTYIVDNELSKKEEITEDEYGNHLSTINYVYINGAWNYEGKSECTYDEVGNKLDYKAYIYLNNQWIKIFEDKYIKGERKRVYSLNLNEDNTFNFKTEYTYDSTGNKTSEIHYDFKNGEWVKVEPSSSENKVVHKKEDVQEGVYKTVDEVYDKNDKLISASEIYYWNEKPSNKTEITYNHDEKVAYAIAYNYVNDAWVLLEKYEFSYDEKGVSTGLIISNYVNDAWLYRTKQEYIYDENGNKIEEHDSKYVNGKWIVCEKLKKINGQEQLKLYYNLALNEDGSFNNQWESEYDENGNELLNIYQEYVNGEWVNKSKQECAYDENGNLLSTIYSVYINGAWNYKDKSEFTYDEAGNRTSEKKYSYQNAQWVLDEHN